MIITHMLHGAGIFTNIYQHLPTFTNIYQHYPNKITQLCRSLYTSTMVRTAWHSPAEEFEGHEVVVFFETAAGAHGKASQPEAGTGFNNRGWELLVDGYPRERLHSN